MTPEQTPPADMERLRWQCRRGMLELDEILLAYLEGPFLQATQDTQHHFRELLGVEDPLLNQWLILGQPPDNHHFADIVTRIRAGSGLRRA